MSPLLAELGDGRLLRRLRLEDPDEIWALVEAERDPRSRAIPERLGFTQEGIAREDSRGSGGFYDLAVYSLLEYEWPRQ